LACAHIRAKGRAWWGASGSPRSAHDDVVSHLALDARNAAELPSPTVNGDAVSFLDDDVTNGSTSICVLIGSFYGRARGTLIEHPETSRALTACGAGAEGRSTHPQAVSPPHPT
jgi:hypothetical protein